jgi:hypothetical protein
MQAVTERDLQDPAGCELCWPASPAEADLASRGLQAVTTLVDESHYIVRVSACTACGQRFLHVFTETIDWADGDDPCVRARLPVTESELLNLGGSPSEAALSQLAPSRRYLCSDAPKGTPATTSWRYGLQVGRHD